MTPTSTLTVTYQKMGWTATFKLSEQSGPTAKAKVTSWPDFPIIKSLFVKKEEDYTNLFVQYLSKEIFLFLTAAGPSTSVDDVKSWFKFKTRFCRLDGSSGFQLISMSQVVVNFQEFIIA